MGKGGDGDGDGDGDVNGNEGRDWRGHDGQRFGAEEWRGRRAPPPKT